MRPASILIVATVCAVLALGVAGCSGRSKKEPAPAARKGSPVAPVEREGDGWKALMGRAKQAAGARQPEWVIEVLEGPTLAAKSPPVEAIQLLAQAYLEFDRPEDAEAVIEHGLKSQPKSVALKAARAGLDATLGKRKLEDGLYKQAGEHFKKALAATPPSGQGLKLRQEIAAAYRESARALEATGDHERAVTVLKDSLELDPENPPSIRLLGNVLRGAGRTRDAVSFYELYLMYEPDDREMADELAELYRETGDEAKRQQLLARFSAPSTPGPPAALVSQPDASPATAALEPPLPEEELEEELSIARDERERADVYLKWGKAAAADKDYKRASELLRTGLELNPTHREVLLALADVLRLSRKPGEARRLYETHLEAEPKDHEVRFLLAKLLVATGASREALAHLRRLSVEPALTRQLMLDAYNWLGIAYAQMGEYGAAEDSWNEVLKVEPRHANAHYNLGQVRERQSKFKEAVDAFERAVEYGGSDPDFLRYLERLGLAYRQMGQRQAAADVWNRLVAVAPAGSAAAERARKFQAESGLAAAGRSGSKGPAGWRRAEEPLRARLPQPQSNRLEAGGGGADAGFLAAADKAFRQGQIDEAIHQYNQALNAEPGNLDTYFKLGDLLHQKGAIGQERALFQQMLAQKLPPDLEQAARFRLQGLSEE